MKKKFSVLLVVVIIISFTICLSSCKQKDGVLEEVNNVLLSDPELNSIFSDISVEVSSGEYFYATLIFKDTTSEMVSKYSPDEGCALSKTVHNKIKAAVLNAGYTKIGWIEGMIYSSDWKDIDNNYCLSFKVGRENKTFVKVWEDANYPLWEEEVPWGGYGG